MAAKKLRTYKIVVLLIILHNHYTLFHAHHFAISTRKWQKLSSSKLLNLPVRLSLPLRQPLHPYSIHQKKTSKEAKFYAGFMIVPTRHKREKSWIRTLLVDKKGFSSITETMIGQNQIIEAFISSCKLAN